MIESAARTTDAGGRFYAVGAGHLGGENGVIALLRKAGLSVEPVY
ncbi:MAG: TraB/GumN family protein [Bacteroidota bacterium]